MQKATPEEIKEALQFAQQARVQGQDPHHLIKVLLDFSERLSHLVPVFHAAERYLHSGQAENEHIKLIKALEHARREEAHRAHQDVTDLGLN